MEGVEPGRIVVMGVAGCGKSSLARALAAILELPLLEGDDYHPASNLARMREGLPLRDVDRWPWLDRLHTELAKRPGGAVLACSALKRSYRRALLGDPPLPLRFVWLAIEEHQARDRLQAREDHFFPAELLADQFATLEEPAAALRLPASLTVAEAAAEVCAWLVD